MTKYIILSILDRDKIATQCIIDGLEYINAYKEKVVIFTDNEKSFEKLSGYKAVPYNFVKGIKDTKIILVNNRGNNINPVISDVLPDLENCCVIINSDQIQNDVVCDLIQASKDNSINLIWNCEFISTLSGSKLIDDYSGFKVHKGMTPDLKTCLALQDQFGQLQGTGLYLVFMLKQIHKSKYLQYLKDNNQKEDPEIMNDPIYYYRSRIIINEAVWDSSIDQILEENQFIDKTKLELEELFGIK